MIEEGITITEAKNRIARIENNLKLLREKKNINFIKTQPRGSIYKELAIPGTNTSDKFAHFIIADATIDKQIISLERELIAYNTFILDEIERMQKYDEIALISYLREQGKQWREIDQKLHRSDGYSRLKFARYKKQHIIDNK